ncbi:Nonribosomal peptide synthetase 4-like protein 1 [Colletotrichum chlorophyti]|uniref:Nonribosomal peptide synthetase 4-like protein 1 n=1 Tax=Colletotrichum chlorophyti TaxID=708187 RepID=A0A1Q8S7V1_9PEZI|nr:Nonribosomal peptide synthetase 4-like protein 1 [Colletotrichum chlorophyti]
MPVGAVGELMAEGPIVAREYMVDADKPHAAFPVDVPWRSKVSPSHARFCRTGDLVKYAPDGPILNICRRDGQLKRFIAPSVTALCVEVIVPHGEAPGKKATLVTFIALGEDFQADDDDASNILPSAANRECLISKLGDVERRLSEVLPQHMVPHAFFPLRSLPLTVSGKIDRRELREIAANIPLTQYSGLSLQVTMKRKALTPAEKTLQSLWNQVLSANASNIGSDDNLLDIGGDSLKAMRLSAAAQRAGFNLPVAAIFQTLSLSEMAKRLEAAANAPSHRNHANCGSYQPFSCLAMENEDVDVGEEHVARQISFDPLEIEDAAWASDMQTKMMEASKLPERFAVYYVILDFDRNTGVDTRRLRKACRKVVKHYPALRTLFVYRKGRMLQTVLRSPYVEFDERTFGLGNSIEDETDAYVAQDRLRET